jgi:hypothetical protein
MLVGAEDRQDRGAAEEIYEKLDGEDAERVVLVKVPGNPLRGTALLRPPQGDALFDGLARQDGNGFLDRWVKARNTAPDLWRDRTGR